jgi:L-ascorbate metabolism protein UlaG (beta-lactamase superfamily)
MMGSLGSSLDAGQGLFETDKVPTAAGELQITFIGHGSLMFAFGGKIIHVDPYGVLTDYSKLPKADLILITHEHRDHYDLQTIMTLKKAGTAVVLTKTCAANTGDGTVMANGDTKDILGLKIEAVPAYNIIHKRSNGELFHPKGRGNGYVITFGDKRVYIGGDTENIPEMKVLKNIDIAFLPVDLPYTMTPDMAALAAGSFGPKIVYPYHYGDTEVAGIKRALGSIKGTDLRIRKMR